MENPLDLAEDGESSKMGGEGTKGRGGLSGSTDFFLRESGRRLHNLAFVSHTKGVQGNRRIISVMFGGSQKIKRRM